MPRRGSRRPYQIAEARAWMVLTLARLNAEHERLARLLALYEAVAWQMALRHPVD